MEVLLRKLCYHASLGLLNDDGSTKDGKFEATDSEEVCFHHRYKFITDHLTLCMELNTHPKNRGVPSGPILAETDIQKIKVTKQVVARLDGQAYQISGSFLDPMPIGLKILFSQSCRLAKNWTEVIQDEEFV